MITHPTAEELIQAVVSWIDQLRPSLDPRNAFLARVASNALAVVGREVAQGANAEAAATARIGALIGRDGSYAELNTELCNKIANGELTVETPGLISVLRENILEQISIDQPKYAHA